MRKVLHIIHGFSQGGAEKLVLGYLERFQNDKNIEIFALALNQYNDNIMKSEIERKGLSVEYINEKHPKNNMFSKFVYMIRLIISINKKIKEIRPDVVHSHLQILHLILIPTIINKIEMRFHTIHGNPRKLSFGFTKFFDKLAFKYFRFVPIVLTNQMKEEVLEYYKIKKACVVHNGIDNNRFSIISKNHDKDASILTLGTIGRLTEVKNQHFLIEILKKLKDNHINAKLIIIGDGPLYNTLLSFSKEMNLLDDIHIIRGVSDVVEHLKNFDLFLFPSLSEGLGIAYIEAQFMNIPCIISDGVPLEAVISNKTIRIPLNIDLWYSSIVNFDNIPKVIPISSQKDFIQENTDEVLRRLYLGGKTIDKESNG